MDYNNGDFLAHYQWRVMQDSVMFVWGLFQDDEDGMWTNDALAKKYKEIEEKCRNIFKTAYQKGNNIVYYVLHQNDEYYNDGKSNKDQSPQNTANNHKRSFSLDYFPGVLTYENGTTKIADLNFKIPYELLDNYLIIEPFSETGNFIQNNQQTDAEFIFFLDLQEKVRMCYVNNMDETLFKQLSSENEDDKSEGLTKLAEHVRDNWPGCYEMEDDVRNILIALKGKFRSGQGIEYTANGKNYRLNDKDELETSELSEEDIKTGNFKSSYKEMSRFVRNPSGVIQISAYGINKFTRAFDDKNISLEDLAETYKVLANNYLNENQIKEFDAIIKESESKEFKNGEKIVIAKANAFKILSEVGGIGYTFLTDGIVEQQVYTKNDESIVKIPALVTGSTEQIGQEAKDIKDIASFAYNVVFDSNYRNQIPEKFDGMGENPYDSATDVLCSAALGIDKNMLKEIFDKNADEGRVHHIESRVLTSITITAIEIVLTGGGSILKEAFKKSASSAAKKAEKSFCKRLAGTVSVNMTKEAILKDANKFAWGAGIEIAIYLAFYKIFKKEDSVFPTEDFLNDAVLAGAANVTDNKTLQSIYACESTVDLNRIMQALNQEGVFAPDYVGADKKEPYECLSEAGAECLLGAGLTYFGGNLTDKFIKWITYLRPSSAMKASDIVHGFVELLDKNVVGTSAFNKWIKTNEGKYFGDRLISILSDVKKLEALKELAAGGFDFKKINDFHTIEELLRLKEYKYVPKELVERLKAVDNSEMLIKMLSLYQKNGKNSAEVMDYFSFEFINAVSDVVNNPELKKRLPNKNIEEMWKYLHEKMTLYACNETESQIKYVLTDGKVTLSFRSQSSVNFVLGKVVDVVITTATSLDDNVFRKYE
ncbi:MAG: hypothetical protein PUC42_05655 [Bacteroidales bacterium]|nr:hypothetical protein [Bacteroidales bacterium]